MKRFATSLLALPLVVGLACKKAEPPPPPVTMPPATLAPATLPAPVGVSVVTLGSALGADKRVTAASETFGVKDTVYAVVETTGTGRAKLRALWTFVKGDKTAKVDETTIELDATGPAVTEFHVVKPSGWPKGDYKVEIFLDDAATPAATKTFKVA
jgi:hypothetical protein